MLEDSTLNQGKTKHLESRHALNLTNSLAGIQVHPLIAGNFKDFIPRVSTDNTTANTHFKWQNLHKRA